MIFWVQWSAMRPLSAFPVSIMDGRSARIRLQLASVYYELGRIPQAEKEANLALNGDILQGDSRAEVFIWLADLKQARNSIQPADEFLKRGLLSADSTDLKKSILRRRALLLNQMGKFSEAITALESAINLDGDAPNPSNLFFLARIYNREGSHHKTLKLLKQLSQIPDTESLISRNGMLLETGRAYLGQQKLIRSLETFLEILDSNDEKNIEFIETRKILASLKKQLQTPEGLKAFKLDGPDRKILGTILARIPDEEDFFYSITYRTEENPIRPDHGHRKNSPWPGLPLMPRFSMKSRS